MSKLLLMNKDITVATVDATEGLTDTRLTLVKQFDDYLPYGIEQGVGTWVDTRHAAKHRKSIQRLLVDLGLTSRLNLLSVTHGVSLNDTFWVKDENSDLVWDGVSPYRNDLDDVVAHTAFGVGLAGKAFTSTTPELADSGSFPKCWTNDGNNLRLVKRGSEGAANAGQEPLCEALASQLLSAARCDSVKYRLIKYHGLPSTACDIFTSEEYGFVPHGTLFPNDKDVDSVIETWESLGFGDEIRELLVMDAVAINIDRHTHNLGFMMDNDTGEILHPSPIFDLNMCCLPYLMETDDPDEYLSDVRPKLGGSFCDTAQKLLTGYLRSKLINLKSFEFTVPNPKMECPQWRLDVLNMLKERQIKEILGQGVSVMIDNPLQDPDRD